MYCHWIAMGNLFCGEKLAVTSNLCKRQTIWHRLMKFWYKKRQSILFERKSISKLCFLASLSKGLILFFSRDWSPCNLVQKKLGPEKAFFANSNGTAPGRYPFCVLKMVVMVSKSKNGRIRSHQGPESPLPYGKSFFQIHFFTIPIADSDSS